MTHPSDRSPRMQLCPPLTQRGRVGIFGGSFDPLHFGHMSLCDYLLDHRDESRIDQIWLMPTPHNPLKPHATLLSYRERCERISEAIDGDLRYSLCNVEGLLSPPHYTAHTLEVLRRHYVDCTFSLIIGADNLASLHRWRDYDRILAVHPIIVYPRRGFDLVTISRQYPTATLRLMTEAPILDISSTEIRRAISQGEPPVGML